MAVATVAGWLLELALVVPTVLLMHNPIVAASATAAGAGLVAHGLGSAAGSLKWSKIWTLHALAVSADLSGLLRG
jgi:hypothetical protein